ncbi:MAG: hypothetical protein V4581_11310, partial [Bacteroidota bacterium]
TTILLNCSPSRNLADVNTYMPVIQNINYKGIDILYALKNKDTVVFVLQPEVKIKEHYKVTHVKYSELHTIDKVITGSDTLYFLFSMYDTNKKLLINAGSGSPGAVKITLHTFRSFPYLIENDTVFVYEK